jgi:hypothetical protein
MSRSETVAGWQEAGRTHELGFIVVDVYQRCGRRVRFGSRALFERGNERGLTLSGETGSDDGQRSVQVEHDQPGPLEVGVRIGRGCGGSGHGVVDVVRKSVEVASDV